MPVRYQAERSRVRSARYRSDLLRSPNASTQNVRLWDASALIDIKPWFRAGRRVGVRFGPHDGFLRGGQLVSQARKDGFRVVVVRASS